MNLKEFATTLVVVGIITLGNHSALAYDSGDSEAQFNRATKMIGEVYKTTLNGFNEETRLKIVEAQRSWVKFRIDNCNAIIAAQDVAGSSKSAALLDCQTEMTNARIKELQKQYAN